VFDGDAGQLGDFLRCRGNWTEAFVNPDVHGLTGDADGAGALGGRFPRNFFEDVRHRKFQLMQDGEKLLLDDRRRDVFGEARERVEAAIHRVIHRRVTGLTLPHETNDTTPLSRSNAMNEPFDTTERAEALAALLSPVFTDLPPNVIATTLAELMAIFLRSHDNDKGPAANRKMRKEILNLWCGMVMGFVDEAEFPTPEGRMQ
jgi:hypothetical protein